MFFFGLKGNWQNVDFALVFGIDFVFGVLRVLFLRLLELLLLLMDVENVFFEVVGYDVVGDAENLFYHDWRFANGL